MIKLIVFFFFVYGVFKVFNSKDKKPLEAVVFYAKKLDLFLGSLCEKEGWKDLAKACKDLAYRFMRIFSAIFSYRISGLERNRLQDIALQIIDKKHEVIRNYQGELVVRRFRIDDTQHKISTQKDKIEKYKLLGGADKYTPEIQEAQENLALLRQYLSKQEEDCQALLKKMKPEIIAIMEAKEKVHDKFALMKVEAALAQVTGFISSYLNMSTDPISELGDIFMRMEEEVNRSRARSKVALNMSSEPTA